MRTAGQDRWDAKHFSVPRVPGMAVQRSSTELRNSGNAGRCFASASVPSGPCVAAQRSSSGPHSGPHEDRCEDRCEDLWERHVSGFGGEVWEVLEIWEIWEMSEI